MFEENVCNKIPIFLTFETCQAKQKKLTRTSQERDTPVFEQDMEQRGHVMANLVGRKILKRRLLLIKKVLQTCGQIYPGNDVFFVNLQEILLVYMKLTSSLNFGEDFMS